MSDKVPPTFCVAPWTHTYLSPQSERRMCCASREQASWQKQYIDRSDANQGAEYQPIPLDEHWNSPHMMSVRKRILAGENIPECQVCNGNILNLYTYKDYFNKTLFPHKIDEAVASTAADGRTTMKPISFDYRIHNLCNFKCRMCGEQLSSSWEAEKRTMKMWDEKRDRWMIPINKEKIETFQKNVAEQELWDAARNGTLEEIYWVGGEPLMYEIHWDIMQYLVDSGKSKDVVVRYNTNLSRTSYKGINLYDLLPHFKRVNLCASQDATGKYAEYIRTGLNWDVWVQNFRQGVFLNDLFGDNAMVIDVTLTLPGLLDMKNLIDFAVQMGTKSYVKITFDFDASAIMSPMCLPHEILDPILDDLIAYEAEHGNALTKVYSETFRDMKTRQTFQEKYPDWQNGLRNGKQRYEKIATHRNDVQKGLDLNELLSVNETVKQWWDSI